MKATLKSAMVSYVEIEYSTKSQEDAIAWGNGKIRKGPDGGVFVNTGDSQSTYAATGKFIVDSDGLKILSIRQFKLLYCKVEEIDARVLSPRETKGKELWELMGFFNERTPTWKSLSERYRASWMNLAEKVIPK
jgi:hypothetical protein